MHVIYDNVLNKCEKQSVKNTIDIYYSKPLDSINHMIKDL